MSSAYQPYTLDHRGVTSTLENIPFNSNMELILELSGSMTHNSKFINYDIVNNHLIIIGLDGGLTSQDIINLTHLYKSGGKGLSKHGVGARAAATQLTQKTSCYDTFQVIGFNKTFTGIEFSVSQRGTKPLNEEESKIKFDEYIVLLEGKVNEETYSKTGLTMWIVPVDEELKVEFNNIKFGIKKLFNYKILGKEIDIYFGDEKLEITEPLFFNSNRDNSRYYKKCQVLRVKMINEFGQPCGNPVKMYKLGDKYFRKEGKTIREYTQQNFNIEENISSEFQTFLYGPESNDQIALEYNIPKTKINGFYYSLNNVLISPKSIQKHGYRGTGDKDTGIIVINERNIDDLIQTNMNKSTAIVPKNFMIDFMIICAFNLRKFRREVYVDQYYNTPSLSFLNERQSNKCANSPESNEFYKKILNYDCPLWKNGGTGEYDESGSKIDKIDNETYQGLCHMCCIVKNKRIKDKKIVY